MKKKNNPFKMVFPYVGVGAGLIVAGFLKNEYISSLLLPKVSFFNTFLSYIFLPHTIQVRNCIVSHTINEISSGICTSLLQSPTIYVSIFAIALFGFILGYFIEKMFFRRR